MKISIGVWALHVFAFTAFGDWPQFRGPTGQGVSDANGLPVNWSETENVKWKTAIPGRGWSSPVIFGNEIWMTTANPKGTELSVVCVDRDSGKTIHSRKIFDVEAPQFAHEFNSYASPTPVIEAGRLYASWVRQASRASTQKPRRCFGNGAILNATISAARVRR